MKRSLIAVLLFLFCQIAAGVVMAMIVGNEHVSDVRPLTISMLASEIVLFFILWSIRYFHPSDLLRKVPGYIMTLSIALTFCVLYALNIVCNLVDLPDLMKDQFVAMAKSPLGIATITLAGPVMEEIVFRRIIIDDCLNRTGKAWVAILISAALFGIVHMNPIQVLFAFPTGILFGWLYIRTRSILPGLIGHIVNNTEAVIEMRCTDSTDGFFSNKTDILHDPVIISVFAVCVAASVVLTIALRRKTSKCDSSTLQRIE